MEPGTPWTRCEHLVLLALYRRLPFERIRANDSEVMSYASAIGRSPGAMHLKLGEIVNIDPAMISSGKKIWPSDTPQAVHDIWQYMNSSPEAFAVESRDALKHYGISQ